MNSIDFHEFENPLALANALANSIAIQLRTAIKIHNHATLAVSGGSTPALFFEQLSHTELDWHKVTVLLVDERWVDANHPRSNARLVAEKLLINCARGAKFMGLYDNNPIATGIEKVEFRLRQLNFPIDAMILGMGSDGHTASFFPDGEGLSEATDLENNRLVCQVEAENAGEPRITLTLPVILNARYLALHFEGIKKRIVYDAALKNGPLDVLPIRHVLRNAVDINIFWSA